MAEGGYLVDLVGKITLEADQPRRSLKEFEKQAERSVAGLKDLEESTKDSMKTFRELQTRTGMSTSELEDAAKSTAKLGKVATSAGGEVGRQMRWIGRDIIRIGGMLGQWLSGFTKVWGKIVSSSVSLQWVTEETDREWEDAYSEMGEAIAPIEDALAGLSRGVAQFIAGLPPPLKAATGLFIQFGSVLATLAPQAFQLIGFMLLIRHSLMGIAEDAGIAGGRFGVLSTIFNVFRGTLMGTMEAQREVVASQRKLNDIQFQAGAIITGLGKNNKALAHDYYILGKKVSKGEKTIGDATDELQDQGRITEDQSAKLGELSGQQKLVNEENTAAKTKLAAVTDKWGKFSKVLKVGIPIATTVAGGLLALGTHLTTLGKVLVGTGMATGVLAGVLALASGAAGALAAPLSAISILLTGLGGTQQETAKVGLPLIRTLEGMGYEGTELYSIAEQITSTFESTKATFADTGRTSDVLTDRLEDLGFDENQIIDIGNAMNFSLEDIATTSSGLTVNFDALRDSLIGLGYSWEVATVKTNLLQSALGTIKEQFPDVNDQVNAFKEAMIRLGIPLDQIDSLLSVTTVQAATDAADAFTGLSGTAKDDLDKLAAAMGMDAPVLQKLLADWGIDQPNEIIALFDSMSASTGIPRNLNDLIVDLEGFVASGVTPWAASVAQVNSLRDAFEDLPDSAKDELDNVVTQITLKAPAIRAAIQAAFPSIFIPVTVQTPVITLPTIPTITIPVVYNIPSFPTTPTIPTYSPEDLAKYQLLTYNKAPPFIDFNTWLSRGKPVPVPSYETGALITRAGLAYLHPAERVIPAKQAAMSSNVTVNVNIEKAYLETEANIDALGRQISERLRTEARRMGIFS